MKMASRGPVFPDSPGLTVPIVLMQGCWRSARGFATSECRGRPREQGKSIQQPRGFGKHPLPSPRLDRRLLDG